MAESASIPLSMRHNSKDRLTVPFSNYTVSMDVALAAGEMWRRKLNPKVEFLFDFGSPNAYLAERAIPSIEARTGVKFDYVPILLGGIFKLTNNRSPAESLAGIKNKPEFMQLEMQRFIDRHKIVEYNRNPFFPVNTVMLMRGAVAAQIDGGFDAYFKAAYHHMWEEPKKMDDPAIFHAAFAASGIDADGIVARIQDQDVKNRLIENTQRAVDRGAFGAPTFFVDDEMFYGKDQLRDVEEEILARNAKAA